MYTQTLTQTHTQTHTIKSTRTSTLTLTRTRARTAQAEGETEGFLGLQCPCGDGVAVFESVGPQEHYKSLGQGGSHGTATHVTLPGVVGAITAQGGGLTNAVYRLSLNDPRGGGHMMQADAANEMAEDFGDKSFEDESVEMSVGGSFPDAHVRAHTRMYPHPDKFTLKPSPDQSRQNTLVYQLTDPTFPCSDHDLPFCNPSHCRRRRRRAS